MNQDYRFEDLKNWLSDAIDKPIKAIRPASMDASFRRYFRVFISDQNSYIAVDAPPKYEDSMKFVNIASLMEAMNIKVPKILATNFQEGFMLISDLGAETMLNAIHQEEAKARELYAESIDILLKMQINGSKHVENSVEVCVRFNHGVQAREQRFDRRRTMRSQAVLNACHSAMAPTRGSECP